MRIYISKNNLISIAYFIFGSFFLVQQTTYFKNVIPNSFNDITVCIVLALIFIAELGEIITTKRIDLSNIGLVLATLFIIISFLELKNKLGITFIVSCVIILAARDVDFTYILKTFLLFSSLIFIITIFSSKLGIIPNMLSYQHRLRESLGFSYVSFPSQLCFYFILAYIVYRNNKILYRELFCLYLLDQFVYIKAVTTSPYLLSILMIMYGVLKKWRRKDVIIENKYLSLFSIFSFVIAPCILFWICYKAPAWLFYKVNSLVNGRLVLGVNGINQFGIQWWGHEVHYITLDIFGNFDSNYNFIDSTYIQLLVNYGIIYTLFILFLFVLLMWILVKEKQDIILMAMILISIHSMFDPQLLVLWYSPFPLLIGKTFSFHYLNVENLQFKCNSI